MPVACLLVTFLWIQILIYIDISEPLTKIIHFPGVKVNALNNTRNPKNLGFVIFLQNVMYQVFMSSEKLIYSTFKFKTN